MGKKIIINGADFSQVAVAGASVHTTSELLTDRGYYYISRTNPKNIVFESVPNGAYYSGIIPVKNNMYVENATALKLSEVGDPNVRDIPSIVYLSTNDISGYMSGTEIFSSNGTTGAFAKFSGTLNPPAGATHVLINTNVQYGGDLNSIISWSE